MRTVVAVAAGKRSARLVATDSTSVIGSPWRTDVFGKLENVSA